MLVMRLTGSALHECPSCQDWWLEAPSWPGEDRLTLDQRDVVIAEHAAEDHPWQLPSPAR